MRGGAAELSIVGEIDADTHALQQSKPALAGEDDFTVEFIRLDVCSFLEAPIEQLQRKRIQDLALDHALERSCAIRRIVAFASKLQLRPIGQFEVQLLR